MTEFSAQSPDRPRLTLLRWVLLCTAAETIGMTAASAAATAGNTSQGLGAGAALALVIAGGLIEGAALGWLQGRGLSLMLPGLSRWRWFAVTVVIAGVGWAAASAPAALSGDENGTAPPIGLIVAGGAGLGLVMGAVLGTAQALVLRRQVRHPWRWFVISAVAWMPTMAIIFLGATTPDASWGVLHILLLGAATGAVAGAVLGLVSGAGLPTLDGPSLGVRIIEWMLSSPLRSRPGRTLTVLRIAGARTGKLLDVPVQYADADHGMVVVPAHPETKTWWRNLRRPAAVEFLRDGRWQHGLGSLVLLGDDHYDESRAAYSERWRSLTLPADQLVVLITPI